METRDVEHLTATQDLCALCHMPFGIQYGRMWRIKGLDGQFYCSAEHAAANCLIGPFLTKRAARL